MLDITPYKEKINLVKTIINTEKRKLYYKEMVDITPYQEKINLVKTKIKTIINTEKRKLYYKEIIEIIDDELRHDSGKVKKYVKFAVFNDKEIQELTGVKTIPLNHLALGWYKFYVFIKLPLSILVNFIFLARYVADIIGITSVVDSSGIKSLLGLCIFVGIILFPSILLYVVLYIGLAQKKRWAWILNFIVLIIEFLAYALLPIPVVFNFGVLLAWLLWILLWILLWTLPNWIYFKHREYMFLDAPPEKEKKLQFNGCGSYVTAEDKFDSRCSVARISGNKVPSATESKSPDKNIKETDFNLDS